MNWKRLVIGAALSATMLLGYRFASAVMVAKAIAPPHSGTSQIVKSAIRPKHQMATPHRNLMSEVKLSLVPEARACAAPRVGQMPEPTCDHTTAHETCKSGCGFCGHCPNCSRGPCTIWTCQDTTKLKLCVPFPNPDPVCAIPCADAANQSCTL
jgi:hypothetical protein